MTAHQVEQAVSDEIPAERHVVVRSVVPKSEAATLYVAFDLTAGDREQRPSNRRAVEHRQNAGQAAAMRSAHGAQENRLGLVVGMVGCQNDVSPGLTAQPFEGSVAQIPSGLLEAHSMSTAKCVRSYAR
jgi:hypothetical protein